MRVLTAIVAAVTLGFGSAPVTPTRAGVESPWNWPVASHRIVTAFDATAGEYGPGHRGIDVPARPGEAVFAVATGTVSFVGTVAGVPTISIIHGPERSTYQPVVAEVVTDQAVQAGERIGHLANSMHPSCRAACLHLGRLRGQTYLDPAELLSHSAAYRLIDPEGPAPTPPRFSNGTQWLAGPVTSPFGMRRHPITGVWKLHDGVDIGAACGTAVPAAAEGTVTRASPNGAYGLQVQLQHSERWSTSYSHLERSTVSVGQSVRAGEIVGYVGSSGLSTGCHLHAMSIVDGTPVNPFDTAVKLAS